MLAKAKHLLRCLSAIMMVEGTVLRSELCCTLVFRMGAHRSRIMFIITSPPSTR